MIDSRDEYNKFLKDNWNDDLFLQLILTDDREHPITETPSLILIKNFRTEVLYHISINHQDAVKVVELSELIFDLKKFSGKFFVLDKKSTLYHMNLGDQMYDINLALYLKSDKLINNLDFETSAHKFIRQNCFSYPLHNKVVPLLKHREQTSEIFSQIIKLINHGIFRDKSYIRINNEIIPILSELESNGIFVDENCFRNRFNAKIHNGYVYSQYNIYTTTGRPSNRFGGVNYAALQKDDGSRSCFVSRFGDDGIMMMIDYSAFHPHIISELTNFELSTDVDFYAYMAKLCFKKQNVDLQDISDAKSLTFRQLYGGVEEEYSHVKFFYNLKSFIDLHWKEYKENGYTKTPVFGRKIKNVTEPNPSKIFNYILQATETEISVPILGKVNLYLKNKKSKPVIYTYDSVLFDISLDEMEDVKQELGFLMKDNNRFPIKCYVGKSYGDLIQTVI
jgi:hypothetical protein